MGHGDPFTVVCMRLIELCVEWGMNCAEIDVFLSLKGLVALPPRMSQDVPASSMKVGIELSGRSEGL